MNEKMRGLMGLALRAGQMTPGAAMTLDAVKAGRAALVLLDEGASENTRKKIRDACAYRRVPCFLLPEGWIDQSCGKEGRFAAAVAPGGLCEQMRRLMDAQVQTDNIDQNQFAERGGASVE